MSWAEFTRRRYFQDLLKWLDSQDERDLRLIAKACLDDSDSTASRRVAFAGGQLERAAQLRRWINKQIAEEQKANQAKENN